MSPDYDCLLQANFGGSTGPPNPPNDITSGELTPEVPRNMSPCSFPFYFLSFGALGSVFNPIDNDDLPALAGEVWTP